MSEATRPGEYVDAGGLRTYYEVRGEGEPLIFLHGGFLTVETTDGQTMELSSSYRVYAPERRAHGRTHDVEGPITYEMMAEDTVAFMDAVGIDSAHLAGWSDGALVAMIVALRHPERVRKLVYVGQSLDPDDVRPEAKPMLHGVTRETAPPMFEEMYAAVSPDGPEHWPIVFDKLLKMMKEDRALTLDDLAGVKVPTLVVVGDDDIVSIEYAAAMRRALPDAQVAVVPGTSHTLPLEKPGVLNRLILDFLADEQVPKMMPV